MKKIIIFLALTLIVPVFVYANSSEQTIEKALVSKMLSAQQYADKFKLGALSRYQNDIREGISKQHPNFTKITNLGRFPNTPDKRYLLEVQADGASFYYEVEISTVLRASSDVIPSHVSAIAVFIREIKTAELVDKLRALVK